jgi:CO/xanthine dehydrogenase Mo-binding subunit
MASLERDGTVTISHNAPDVGEGSHTVLSVVAATVLGIPQSQVHVGEPDTANGLPFSGTSSQRTTVQMGTAARNACERLQTELAKAAAGLRGGQADEWQVKDGVVARGDERLTFAELAQSLSGERPVNGVGAYDRGRVEDSSFGSHDYWSPGVAAAEVEVDRETGEIRVLQYAAVADAGHILHYYSARGQIEGGAVMGFGAALFEEVCYDEGQLLNADAFQYRLPQLGDIPETFHTLILENGDGPGPFGSKGIAQTSIPCVAPAVCNAIYDAVGVRLTSTPFTAEKVLKALGKL